MRYRRLGRSGLKVSAVSLGAWTTYGGSVQDKALIKDIVAKAFEGGINFFDNADAYARRQGEAFLGEIFEDLDIPRHHLVLSTKVFWPMSDAITDRGLSRKHVLESIDMSLDRMRTDYVDIYFAHRFDPETPMEEIVEVFSDVVRSGRAHYWGTSEWSAAQIAEAHTYATAHGLVAPVTEQPQYSMLYRERVEQQILPVTEPKGIGLVVWSPLAMGMLTGKYDDGAPRRHALRRQRGLPEVVPERRQRRQGEGAQGRRRRSRRHPRAARPGVGAAPERRVERDHRGHQGRAAARQRGRRRPRARRGTLERIDGILAD
jgi:voltage-dependent potassium channel beta subunit